MSQALGSSEKKNQDVDDEGEHEDSIGSPSHNQPSSLAKDQEWAHEMRRADERTNEMRQKYQSLLQTHL